jgi:hypothetical protein
MSFAVRAGGLSRLWRCRATVATIAPDQSGVTPDVPASVVSRLCSDGFGIAPALFKMSLWVSVVAVVMNAAIDAYQAANPNANVSLAWAQILIGQAPVGRASGQS